MTKKLVIAFAAYIALGALAFTTLSDQRVRGVTLAILAMFAVKTWVRRREVVGPDANNPLNKQPGERRVFPPDAESGSDQ